MCTLNSLIEHYSCDITSKEWRSVGRTAVEYTLGFCSTLILISFLNKLKDVEDAVCDEKNCIL